MGARQHVEAEVVSPAMLGEAGEELFVGFQRRDEFPVLAEDNGAASRNGNHGERGEALGDFRGQFRDHLAHFGVLGFQLDHPRLR